MASRCILATGLSNTFVVSRASEVGDLYVVHVMWMSVVMVLNKDDVKVSDSRGSRCASCRPVTCADRSHCSKTQQASCVKEGHRLTVWRKVIVS